MGLFGIMSYDEAMETLIEGIASKSVLEKAYKRIRKNEYDKSIGRIALHYCFGELYGLGIEKLETSAGNGFSALFGLQFTKGILMKKPCSSLKGC